MKSIVLIGFMGSGKTTVGRSLEIKSGIGFVDIDELIEAKEGLKISEIFSDKGEKYFRKIENEVLKELASADEIKIISTGGGIVVTPENTELLKKLGRVYYLRVKPETVISRLEGDCTRPLLKGEDKLKKVNELMESRKELYEEASDDIIDVDNVSVEEIIEHISSDFGKIYNQTKIRGKIK